MAPNLDPPDRQFNDQRNDQRLNQPFHQAFNQPFAQAIDRGDNEAQTQASHESALLAPVQIIGLGPHGLEDLADHLRFLVDQATLLVGEPGPLSYVADYATEKVVVQDWAVAVQTIREHVARSRQTFAPETFAPAGPLWSDSDEDAGAVGDLDDDYSDEDEDSEIEPLPLIPDRTSIFLPAIKPAKPIDPGPAGDPVPSDSPASPASVVILVIGDPLFFGIGAYLLDRLPAPWLMFHPQVTAVQLAFARAKLPWQDALVVRVQGRSPDDLARALQAGAEKIAVLTDASHHPTAIAALVLALRLPHIYRLWVGENLGDPQAERLRSWLIEPGCLPDLLNAQFSPLNLVILERLPNPDAINLLALPCLGLADDLWVGGTLASGMQVPGDRSPSFWPREVRLQILAELALQPGQIIWDIEAGVGAVSIEMARLCPESTVYAIEASATGISAIERNAVRFRTGNLVSIHGRSPSILRSLPTPDRILLSDRTGNWLPTLQTCAHRLGDQGSIVLALSSIEALAEAIAWAQRHNHWHYHASQIQIQRSIPVGPVTQWLPLPTVAIVVLRL